MKDSSGNEIKAAMVLDTVGMVCPYPIIKTSEAIRAIEAGEVLEVKASDFAITIDMPAWCHGTGHEYLGYEQDGNIVIVFVKKMKGKA